VYKNEANKLYFLLAHPGGPYYKNKDEGSWGIPKGLLEEGEDPLHAAIREFKEETSLEIDTKELIELPTVRYKNGKTLLSWAARNNHLSLENFRSNSFQIIWPPKSNTLENFDEIDALNFFDYEVACKKIHPVQLPLIEFIFDKEQHA